MISAIIQIVLIICFPLLAKLISKHTFSWLSPVVICYTLGIVMANFSFFSVNNELANYFTQGTILLAIPFLLYSTNFSDWMSDFKSMVLAFLFCVLCGIVGTSIAGWLFHESVGEAPVISGMIAAIFSGGIPNMQAVGMALSVKTETIVLLNAADIFIGGMYLIFLTSVASNFLGVFLNNYQIRNLQLSKIKLHKVNNFSYKDFTKGLALTVGIIGVSVALSFLIYQELAATFIILSLTTLSILASQLKFVQTLKGTFETGDYLLLMFCVAVGMLANFNNVLEKGWLLIQFMATAWSITVILHWLLCYLFKIDKDTCMVASTAAIYGPVFIGQIASTIENRKLVFPGIALGLLGIAVGNYVGISVAWIMQQLL